MYTETDSFQILGAVSASLRKRLPNICVYFLCWSQEEAQATAARMAGKAIAVFLVPGKENGREEPDFSPWPSESVFPGQSFCGGGRALLRRITEEAVPKAEKDFDLPVEKRFLIGYSLAGLCSLDSLYITDCFSGVGGVSASTWYPGWVDYVKNHEPVNKDAAVYLSVGVKEKNTRIPNLSRTEDTMKDLSQWWTGKRPVRFELNPGTHSTDPPGRMVKAASALLELTGCR